VVSVLRRRYGARMPTVDKQVPITERNVRIALKQAGEAPWVLTVAPGDDLVARRIVCDGTRPDGAGGFVDVPAALRDVRLEVDPRRPRGVWSVASA
jgi:hypothetical protein